MNNAQIEYEKKDTDKKRKIKLAIFIVLGIVVFSFVLWLLISPCSILGHNTVHYKEKAPTCTEPGYAAYDECKRCDFTTFSEIPVKEHSWSKWKTIEEATYNHAGEKLRKCKSCGEEEYDRIPKREKPISKRLPYIGMSGDDIDSTKLGKHTKTGKNKRYFVDDYGTHRVHDCTLYYWMEGSSCIFLARVDDDTNEVINVDDQPAGSYFGN